LPDKVKGCYNLNKAKITSEERPWHEQSVPRRPADIIIKLKLYF